jgi:ATP phosphoribosyltransferase regulatory subunit
MDAELRTAIAQLRSAGHTVVCALPGHEHELDEFECDRELVRVPADGGVWILKNL